MSLLPSDLRVIDCDTHLTEPHDLWVKRAPAAFKDRVPRVVDIDGRASWVVGDKVLGFAGGGGVIDTEGAKHSFGESMMVWGIDRIHRGAWDPEARIEVMNDSGVHAQVLFPNAVGFGEGLSSSEIDPVLRLLSIQIYNDAMAEMQSDSDNRLLPMPIMPVWDIDLCVREATRVADLGLRGVNMTSDAADVGSPDLSEPAWDPLWQVCVERSLPVHFHIGASLTAMNFFGKYFWQSQRENTKAAIGGSMLFLGNARVIINTILSGMFDRNPGLKMVSVESGIGWIPFILETIDYEMDENAPADLAQLQKMPSQYFKDHWYSTFWFEQAQGKLQALVDAVGDDNILFETDFPHPTCLYPKPLDTIAEKMSTLTESSRRKILGDNAVKLYRL
ncbi:MAG: amidohydrolase family protein [Actinobacteria bacterium]|uniref:Unannotated protein n=1 Tax=freshwater metagenome TaxID=449393 RepID=A0A6J7K3B2_9ZZZZ|nr:amidohydrolase family protein [Actinomycetota bacterium]MSW78746.1 amidohydrolase family protein [Actinomycetota bacterium]MSX57132.1 amidohydrolase family protein [Actinomycetota bacterium]MSX93660.1 amidohydrolase family protein [Actinomycetota bacterium]MSZ84782.1 amidohydrolase family protein [Actinomycetota bacterium]